jgi:hypothetical protein
VTASGEPDPLSVNGVRAPSRTGAATAARKRKRAERLASDLAPRVTLLDDQWLVALADVLTEEIAARGLLGTEVPGGA